MRSPASMDIIQIDVTNKCHLRCSNCTRLVAHQDKPWEMDLDTFTQAVASMEGWSGDVLGVMGGEPTSHSDFERISRTFADSWGSPEPLRHGRQPIGDMNQFVTERLHDRSSGRGLWSALGKGFYEHFETICEVYGNWTINTHENAGRHQALLITRQDYCAQTGLSSEDWEKNRDTCWVQNLWSASINPRGAYFCEVAAAIDDLYFQGKHAWPVEQGWWQRTPAEFKDQIDLCNYCALAQPGPSTLATDNRDLVSPGSKDLLLQVGSPAAKRGRVTLYDTSMNEQRRVTTRDSYLSEPDLRVRPESIGMRPRKVTGIVTCSGRAQHLKQTLAHNYPLVDELIVVTTPDDQETRKVVLEVDCGLEDDRRGDLWDNVIDCERCFDNGHAFNKGRMLNVGLTRVECLEATDWILFFDADIFLHADTLKFLKSHTLNPGCLYGTRRLDAADSGSLVNSEPNGFFQLFHPSAQALRTRSVGGPGTWPNVLSEEFCSAGGIDSWFMQQYPATKRILLPQIPVTHIPHGAFGQGWNGVQRKDTWRQCAWLTSQGWFPLESVPARGSVRLRLVDTLYGKVAELELADGERSLPTRVVQSDGQGGLLFCGISIGSHHVHVAYRS